MPGDDTKHLGMALGLTLSGLNKMHHLPDDLVAAWLRREVKGFQKGKPTLRTLATALTEIGHIGLANDILGILQLIVSVIP